MIQNPPLGGFRRSDLAGVMLEILYDLGVHLSISAR
jgi:hypothetical protein